MLQQMFESSRPQLLIAVLLLGFGLFLLGSGRGASPMLWGGNGVVCGRGRNPTLRLWPTIFSGKIDVFPGDRRSRLISSMTSVAPA